MLCTVGVKWPCSQDCWCCTPTARGCNPLVEQVVMATDDFYYDTSGFTFWAQLGLGNFQLKHLSVKAHAAPARGGSTGAPWCGWLGQQVPGQRWHPVTRAGHGAAACCPGLSGCAELPHLLPPQRALAWAARPTQQMPFHHTDPSVPALCLYRRVFLHLHADRALCPSAVMSHTALWQPSRSHPQLPPVTWGRSQCPGDG